jgi:hypothetical protein
MAAVDIRQATPSRARTLPKQWALKGLHSPPPQGARPKLPRRKRSSVPALTVGIDEDDTSPSFRSASLPRPLPQVPIPQPLSALPLSAVAGPSSRPRPLPLPPLSRKSSVESMVEECSSSDDAESSDGSSSSDHRTHPPYTHPRPLPEPDVCRTPSSRRVSRHVPAKSTPLDQPPHHGLPSRSRSPPFLPPIETFKHTFSLLLDLETPTQRTYESLDPVVSSSRTSTPRFVLNLSQTQLSDTSDATSEESDSDSINRVDHFDDPFFQMVSEDHDDIETSIDYAWALHDDVLVRQKAHDVESSKWYMEKKGKRTTEQDYESIRKLLRSL